MENGILLKKRLVFHCKKISGAWKIIGSELPTSRLGDINMFSTEVDLTTDVNFDNTGKGVSDDYLGWALCNGGNGTVDLRERFIAGSNFGTGSSREHAPWALLDFGFKCIISSSFADIFYNNCFKNGILPIKISEDSVIEISQYSNRKEEIEVNLESQEIIYGNKTLNFNIDEFKKKCLTDGLDDIALSMEKVKHIDQFEKKINLEKPWVLNND